MLEFIVFTVMGAVIGGVVARVWMSARTSAYRVRATELEAELIEQELADREQRLQLEQEFEARKREARADAEQHRGDLLEREAELDALEVTLDERERSLATRENAIRKGESRLAAQREKLVAEETRILAEVERVAAISQDEARAELRARILDRARQEAGAEILALQKNAALEADAHAAVLIATAAHRMAAEFVSSHTVTLVPLASDELKGRIIGREGRNIRAFENATGVDLIVDDTPERVVLSGFSPLRREVARRALEQLLDDGRIHPARIEHVVKGVREELDSALEREGEALARELSVGPLQAELCRMLGRLRLHYQEGQSLLELAKQTAILASTIADELSASSSLTRRCCVLVYLGRIADHQIGGHHLEAALELARRHGEEIEVVSVLKALARRTPDSVVAISVETACRLASARRRVAGASKANDEQSIYIKRCEEMEALAGSIQGVERAYAIQAGREMRVMVNPSTVDDATAAVLADEIAAELRSEIRFNGEVRVTIIRETRATEVAR